MAVPSVRSDGATQCNSCNSVPLLGFLLATLLLAFGLRVYHLDYQSFWSDEGISVMRSSLSLGDVLRDMPVEHAPGYFLLLHFWMKLLKGGASDFAVRYVSLFPSVLVIAIGYRWASDLGSRRAGLIVALLLATNAFQIWYAQEARMYSWLLAAGAGSTWLLGRLLPVRRRSSGAMEGGCHSVTGWSIWAGYVGLTASTIYLQHYGLLVPLAHAAYALVWLWRTRGSRAFLRWVAAGATVALLYLPWLPRMLGIFGFPGWRQPLDPWQLPWRIFTAYTVGDAMPSPWRAWLPLLYAILALAGVVAWWRPRFLSVILLLSAGGVPLLGAFLLALRQPDFHERYIIMASTPLLLAASIGLASVARLGTAGPAPASVAPSFILHPSSFILHLSSPSRRPVARAGAALLATGLLFTLVLGNLLALQRLYRDPSLHKPDYRAAAARIEAAEQPGDIIVVDGPDPQKAFLRYYRGRAPVLDLRSLQGTDPAGLGTAMQKVTSGASRAWGVLYFHTPGPVQAWLAGHGWPAAETFHNGIWVMLYGLPVGLGPTTLPTPLTFGPELRLIAAEAACATPESSAATGLCAAGDLLRVTTHWDVLELPPALRFSLRLTDAQGRLWASEDYVPQDGFAPTEGWQPGAPAVDRRGLWLPPDLPPGPYRLSLRLYDPLSGEAVPTDAGEDAPLASVSVGPATEPPDPSELPIERREDWKPSPELRLLGWATTPSPLHTDQPAELVLWWQALGRPTDSYSLRARLEDAHGVAIGENTFPLSIAPPAQWRPGQVVRERYGLELDPAAQPGRYSLVLSLIDGRGSAESTVSPWRTGPVRVLSRPRTYRLPRLAHRVDATIGDAVVLRGYDVTDPGAPGSDQPIALTLYWQAGDRVPGNYKVFVHLLDQSGQIVAQSDAAPAGGTAPTQSWLPGEVVVDPHTLWPPGEGTYRLVVGMYDPVSGVRPPAADAGGAPLPDGAVPLGTVQVVREAP